MASLFSTAEARAFDKGQLASATDYPDLVITTKEAEIRQRFEARCGVNFVPTSHTETLDGDGSDYLMLTWPKVTSVDSLRIDGTDIDSSYLSLTDYSIGMAVTDAGLLTWRGGTFTAGWGNVIITYTAGHASVPYDIKRAALLTAVNELPGSNVPWETTSYDAGGTSYNLGVPDGFAGRVSAIPEVMRALRQYDYSYGGIT